MNLTSIFHPSVFASPIGEILVFGLGLIFGSFFNVCIYRIPLEKNIFIGRSRCPKCSTTIPWYYNIPLLGYLLLLGRCSHCKSSISIQYPAVELASGLLILYTYFAYGWTLEFLLYASFVSSLLVVSVIDLHHRIIPDVISLPGIVIGFGASFILSDITWLQSLLGILVGGGSFLAIAYLYEKSAQREGLGGGDVKLLGMIGAWLGVQSILAVIIISSALGSIVGLSVLARQKGDLKTAIPFGPFLALGAGAFLFWGDRIQKWLLPGL